MESRRYQVSFACVDGAADSFRCSTAHSARYWGKLISRREGVSTVVVRDMSLPLADSRAVLFRFRSDISAPRKLREGI